MPTKKWSLIFLFALFQIPKRYYLLLLYVKIECLLVKLLYLFCLYFSCLGFGYWRRWWRGPPRSSTPFFSWKDRHLWNWQYGCWCKAYQILQSSFHSLTKAKICCWQAIMSLVHSYIYIYFFLLWMRFYWRKLVIAYEARTCLLNDVSLCPTVSDTDTCMTYFTKVSNSKNICLGPNIILRSFYT